MRDEHLFKFSGKTIGTAALEERAYHAERVVHWQEEKKKAVAKIKSSHIEITEHLYDSKYEASIFVETDRDDKDRLVESINKIHFHEKAVTLFQIKAVTYGDNPDVEYDLTLEDIVHFRLAGGPRES